MSGENETRRAMREKIVCEHMASENTHDFRVTMGAFSRPRYEIGSSGDDKSIFCERVYFDWATILRHLGLMPETA